MGFISSNSRYVMQLIITYPPRNIRKVRVGLMSCPIHLSAFNSFSTEEVCKECGFKGWTPGDGKVYPIPKLKRQIS